MTMIQQARPIGMSTCPEWCELPPGHDAYTPGNGRQHVRTFGAVTVEQYENGEQEWPVTIGIDHWISLTDAVEGSGTLSLEEAATLADDLPKAVAYLQNLNLPTPEPLTDCPPWCAGLPERHPEEEGGATTHTRPVGDLGVEIEWYPGEALAPGIHVPDIDGEWNCHITPGEARQLAADLIAAADVLEPVDVPALLPAPGSCPPWCERHEDGGEGDLTHHRSIGPLGTELIAYRDELLVELPTEFVVVDKAAQVADDIRQALCVARGAGVTA